MNILVYEDEIELKNLFEHIDSHISMKVDFCESYEIGKFFYDNNKYDVVIVNFSLYYGQNLLDYILDKNNKQRIITISEKLSYSEKNGCDYCIENNNKIRLLKPTDISELIKSIKQFDSLECVYANKFYYKNGLIEVMDDIARRFNGANYDSAKKSFFIKDSASLLNISEFLSLNNINHSISDTDKIEIIE